ncbi:MAG: HNH endonuclease signature motif containing protein [Chloroflexota bacterium]
MSYIPETLRRQVRERAQGTCEYCLLHENYSLKRHEVDHIRAEKHAGTTALDNLCLSCFDCNRQKGSDLSSVDPVTDEVIPLFHPRRDTWNDNFQIMANGSIEGKTAKGRVIVKLLDFNNAERITIRAALMTLKRYP